jgi:DNA-binding MarR family transcriptional regulator
MAIADLPSITRPDDMSYRRSPEQRIVLGYSRCPGLGGDPAGVTYLMDDLEWGGMPMPARWTVEQNICIDDCIRRRTTSVTLLGVPRPATHPDPADLDLGWNLGVLYRAYLQQANAAFADLPGGPRAYRLLVSVERGAPSAQLPLARRLGIDRTVMTYLIDDLVEAGLVERQVDPRDRRARTIVATERARRLLPELDGRLAEIEGRLLGALSPDQATRLCDLLRVAADDLDGRDPSQDPPDITRAMRGQRRSRPVSR